MGQLLQDVIRNFSGGVVTSKPADELDINESPMGRNSALLLVAGQKALVQKRKGASVYNATPISGSPAVLGQYSFRKYTGAGTYTLYHLAVSNNGRLDVISNVGVAAAADGANPAPFTSGDYFPDFASANNLAFIVNANGDAKKFNGSVVQNIGITRPTVGTMALAAGAAGLHNGTYEARVTFVNTATGQESSTSNTTSATVTVASKILSWSNIPVSADTQVDARRLYLRNTATQANFYLAATIADNTSTTTTTNLSDSSLVTLGPDTDENDPPPANIKFAATHLSRLFLSDGADLFYSKAALPEAFDPDNVEAVNTNDGDQITGIMSAYELLVIFKRNAMYALFGDDPDSWTIRQISSDIGCVSHRSIKTVEGITYWWSLKGPMAWDGTGLPKAIGTPLIQPTISTDNLNFSLFSSICAEIDSINQRVMFALPSSSAATRCDIILPFNYRAGAWEADRWDPFDIASMASIEDTNKVPWVMIGSYSGQVFKWWNATNDGVPASCTTTGTVSSHTTTTVTYTTGAFTTTGGKLVDRYIYIIDPAVVNIQRLRITSNTATVLTIDSATPISGTVTNFTFYIGGPNFSWDTPWMDGQQPFNKKRYEYLYTQVFSTSGAITVNVDLFLDYITTSTAREFSFATTAIGGVWDTSTWDEAAWGSDVLIQKRFRCGKTGRYWRARFRNGIPDQGVTIAKIGMRAELLSDKS